MGFRFLDTRLWGMPIPFHRSFDEVNLRFYVRRTVHDERRRGVVFVKEMVPRFAVASLARRLYGERYVCLPMRHEVRLPEPPGRPAGHVHYGWRQRGAWSTLSPAVEGEPRVAAQDSEASFITEHYWGYAAQRDGSTLEYRVEHPPWRIWPARDPHLRCGAEELYGERFATPLAAPPSSAFLAEGSAVSVYPGTSL